MGRGGVWRRSIVRSWKSAVEVRRLRRIVCLVAVLSAVLVGSVALIGPFRPPPAAAQPASGGTPLLTETFTGASVADPNFIPLGDACLTGAAANSTPPPGQSSLSNCAKAAGGDTGPVPPVGVTPGYLQLTDTAGNDAGAVLYNQPLPSGAGLQITFDQFQYGGSGADGIGFFLVNGSADLTATGATGGALGYAQLLGTSLPQHNGVNSGVLGVGLDAFGNFSNDGEGRGNGCPTASPFGTTTARTNPNAVVLRGAGNGLTGYCFLTATGTCSGCTGKALPSSLRSNALATADRKVRITITPGPNPTVEVEIDFTGTSNSFQTVVNEPLTTPLPSTIKFGLSSSTGGENDVHLIRNVSVVTVEPLNPGINLVKQVAITNPPQPSAYEV